MPAQPASPVSDTFKFGPWTISSTLSHILPSEGPKKNEFQSQLSISCLPEMIFADNVLKVEHAQGYGLNFNCLDALKLVGDKTEGIEVAPAKLWRESRRDCEFSTESLPCSDWTFTTNYSGTLLGKDTNILTEQRTTESIPLDRLRRREGIVFYKDVLLFEDELADNGVSQLRVKIRVMTSDLFILLRFFLRVDAVLVRVYDTRIYHEINSNYFLREFSRRESTFEELESLPRSTIANIDELPPHIKVVSEEKTKLIFPGISKET